MKGCATVITDPELAAEFVDQLGVDLQDQSCSVEVRSLGRTIARWRDQIVAWHQALVTNGASEATNNLIKRIKRIGFGFRRFAHYRIRILLYAGRPNCELLATVAPFYDEPRKRSLVVGVTDDVDHIAIGCTKEEAPHSPRFVSEWMNDLVFTAKRLVIRLVNVTADGN